MLSQANMDTIKGLRASSSSDKEFIENILASIREQYENDNTRSSKITHFKNYIGKNGLLKDKENLKLINDRELRIKLNMGAEDRKEPPKKPLKESTIDRIKQFRNSDNPDELVIYLLFATGRRVKEFLAGNFSVRDGELYIDEISKKRTIKSADGYKIYLVPELSPEQFMVLLDKFKKGNKRSSSEGVRKAVNRLIKRLDLSPIEKVKDLRPLYIQYLKVKDKEIGKQNGNQIIKELLHHDKKTTSILYNDKYDIISPKKPEELRQMTNSQIRDLLRKTKGKEELQGIIGFNKLNKEQLIKLF